MLFQNCLKFHSPDGLVKLRTTILKYHLRYLWQISPQIMLLPIQIPRFRDFYTDKSTDKSIDWGILCKKNPKTKKLMEINFQKSSRIQFYCLWRHKIHLLDQFKLYLQFMSPNIQENNRFSEKNWPQVLKVANVRFHYIPSEILNRRLSLLPNLPRLHVLLT